MARIHPALTKAQAFCELFGLKRPILLAPMAGASAPSLSIAVARAGGLGACGALLMEPDAIRRWADQVRADGATAFQLNLWIPDPPPARDPVHEARLRTFLAEWGPEIPPEAGDARPPDFAAQCEALLTVSPPIVSSIMGLYPPEFVSRLKAGNIAWFANVSTVAEACAAAAAGADVVVVQGAEAGGHRGCFDARRAEQEMVGLLALLPAVVDAVDIPVVATGGIADARGVAAALLLGASAVQIGTGFLRSPEAQIPRAWAEALAATPPEGTVVSRVFSGRAGRSIATDYVQAAMQETAPSPAPYPVQRGLTARMRERGAKVGDIRRIQAWAGQSSALVRSYPASEIVREVWHDAVSLLTYRKPLLSIPMPPQAYLWNPYSIW
jgi:nitronate monooxygenase